MNRATLCPYFCPTCLKRLYQHGKATSYRCNCGRSYDLIKGEMRPKTRRVVAAEVVDEVRPALAWWEVEELAGWVRE